MNVPAAMYLSRLPLKSQLVGSQVSSWCVVFIFVHFYTIIMQTEAKVPRVFVMLPREGRCAHVTVCLLHNESFSCCHETQDDAVMMWRSGPFVSNVADVCKAQMFNPTF